MGMRRDAAWLKQQRIQAIHRMISGVNEAQLSKVLATCEYKFGINRSTARKYLKTLEDCGFIEVDDDADLILEVKPE